MTNQEMIDVLKAHEAGKEIECLNKTKCNGWCLVTAPIWDFSSFDYREKPETIRVVIFADKSRWLVPLGYSDYKLNEVMTGHPGSRLVIYEQTHP